MNFMDILQNPTKHMSQVEKRRKKLGEIGIEVGDIETMPVEDSDTSLQPIKKPPKEIDANDTFPKYNFTVSTHSLDYLLKCFRISLRKNYETRKSIKI